MRLIKIPMTNIKCELPDWATYVAMDDDGEWYMYEHKPFTSTRIWKKESGKCSHSNLIRCNDGIGVITPELLNILDWKETLFTVEELLCDS